MDSDEVNVVGPLHSIASILNSSITLKRDAKVKLLTDLSNEDWTKLNMI